MPLTEHTAAGYIDDKGQLQMNELHAFRRSNAQMPHGPVTVKVSVLKATRSLRQNAYWWSVPVRLIAEHCGYTPNQMHYALLGECFGYTAGPTGNPVPVKPSSSDLTVEEFKHLIDWVLTWAPTELGVILPEPGEMESGAA